MGELIAAKRGYSIEALTDKQQKLVDGLLDGLSIAEAGEMAGYSTSNGAYQAAASPTVKRALHEFRDNILKVEGASYGMRAVIDLAKSARAEGVRLKAALALLQIAGHIRADGSGAEDDDKAVDEMSMEELQRLAAREFGKTGELVHVSLDDGDSAPVGR